MIEKIIDGKKYRLIEIKEQPKILCDCFKFGTMKNIGLYKENKKAKVGTIIECPICHTKFKKIQYSQAFCCTRCKDKFHNGICSDRHKDINYYEHYNEMKNGGCGVWDDYESGDNDQWGDMELGIHD